MYEFRNDYVSVFLYLCSAARSCYLMFALTVTLTAHLNPTSVFGWCRFAVMACCWALDPEERPKFQQLVQCLTEFHAALGAYV